MKRLVIITLIFNSYSILCQERNLTTYAELWNSQSLISLSSEGLSMDHLPEYTSIFDLLKSSPDNEVIVFQGFESFQTFRFTIVKAKVKWGCGIGSVWGLTNDDDENGLINTRELIDKCEKELSSHSFVPSINELSSMFQSLNPIDLRSFNGYYMSSSELDFYSNYAVHVKNGKWRRTIIAKTAPQKLLLFELANQ